MSILILTHLERDLEGCIVITSQVSQYGLLARTRDALAPPELDISHEVRLSEARLRQVALDLRPADAPEWTAWAHV